MIWTDVQSSLPHLKEVEIVYEIKYIDDSSFRNTRRKVVGLGSFDPTIGWTVLNKRVDGADFVRVLFWTEIDNETQEVLEK